MGGTVPEWLLTACIAVTVFSVMFGIGLSVAPGELARVWRSPAPMLRGLFSVLVAVPVLALAITRAFDLPRATDIGIVLMAISPGAPVALRRSLDAGGHRSFAPSLQIAVVLLAVVSMPLSIAVLDALYGTRASISSWDVARQVLVAQLLPLGLGMALRHVRAPLAERIEPGVTRLGTLLLVATVLLLLIDAWEVTVTAGLRGLAAILLVIYGALAIGHLLGGPDPAMRTAVAISGAARNAGLALLVATQNHAPPEVNAAILAYLLVSVFAIVPYVAWRRRAGARAS